MIPSDDQVIAETRAWVIRAVIGLNLCPFAKGVENNNQIRYAVSRAIDREALLTALCDELSMLAQSSQHETTLLVHPDVLTDFLDYNDFLDAADAAVEEMGYAGELQVASFHPHYQFAGTAADDVTNASNRSPYPTLHILREESVARAVAAFPEAESIYEANMRTLKSLGSDGWASLQAQCRRDAGIS